MSILLGGWKKGEKKSNMLFLIAKVVEKERIDCLLLYFTGKAFLARLDWEWILQLIKVFCLSVCNIWKGHRLSSTRSKHRNHSAIEQSIGSRATSNCPFAILGESGTTNRHYSFITLKGKNWQTTYVQSMS